MKIECRVSILIYGKTSGVYYILTTSKSQGDVLLNNLVLVTLRYVDLIKKNPLK